MGRNDGTPQEQPEHEVEVPDFYIDKTEVTNAEYYSYITQQMNNPSLPPANRPNMPTHWVNGKPIPGQELFPVVFVSMDDIKGFIQWRSKRDNVSYRLPTEEEWEYAARNGGENNLYPWGDSFAGGEKMAVVDQTAAKAVGSAPEGANKAGALDLIGNVWEWTSSNIKPYQGSKVAFSKPNNFVIRGGSYNSKSSGDRGITSTTRYDVEPTRRDGLLGFRLIRPA
jgi:iron(II)-dependent oxidoreductase